MLIYAAILTQSLCPQIYQLGQIYNQTNQMHQASSLHYSKLTTTIIKMDRVWVLILLVWPYQWALQYQSFSNTIQLKVTNLIALLAYHQIFVGKSSWILAIEKFGFLIGGCYKAYCL